MNKLNISTRNHKSIVVILLAITVLLLASACVYKPTPKCKSGNYRRPGNIYTGEEGADVLSATFCRDKSDYKGGQVVHFTLVIENTWDRLIELDGGEKPVLDICVDYDSCWSDHHPPSEWPTFVALAPGESYTLEWDWPATQAEREAKRPKGVSVGESSASVHVWGYWLRPDGHLGELPLGFRYGEP